MASNKVYSEAEINLILNNAKANPGNLRHSFRKSSMQINRTAHSIEQKYYKVIKSRNIIEVSSDTAFYKGKNKRMLDVENTADSLFIAIVKKYPAEKLPELLDRNL